FCCKKMSHVEVFGSIHCFGISKQTMPRFLFQNYIDRLFTDTIVDSGEFGLFRTSLVDLHFVNSVCTDITYSNLWVITKELFAVNQYFCDRFAMRCYGS